MNTKLNILTPQRWRQALVAAMISSFLLLSACGDHHSEPSAARTTSYGSAEAAKAELYAVPQDQMGHLQIISVEKQSFPVILRLPGSVAYNAFQTTPVITQVSGPVSRILVVPGQVVHSGQPMLYVSSPDFAQLRTNYLKAADAYRLSEDNYKRSQDLYAHHAIAQVELLQAESARNQALADMQAAGQALRVVGVKELDHVAQSTGAETVPVFAPISGEVVEQLVSPGQVVQAGSTQVFTISNMSTVWVVVNVYQNDLAHIHMGNEVTITTDAYSKDFHGRISYIAPALDPNTRTLNVRIVTDNPGGMLKKDMYVTAIVQAGTTTALTVPDSSILRDNVNEPFVYAEVGSNQFAQRPVSIGLSENGETQILSGLQQGEKIVGDGSLFLQFASSLQQ